MLFKAEHKKASERTFSRNNLKKINEHLKKGFRNVCVNTA